MIGVQRICSDCPEADLGLVDLLQNEVAVSHDLWSCTRRAGKRFCNLSRACDEAFDYRAQHSILQCYDDDRPWWVWKIDSQRLERVVVAVEAEHRARQRGDELAIGKQTSPDGHGNAHQTCLRHVEPSRSERLR